MKFEVHDNLVGWTTTLLVVFTFLLVMLWMRPECWRPAPAQPPEIRYIKAAPDSTATPDSTVVDSTKGD